MTTHVGIVNFGPDPIDISVVLTGADGVQGVSRTERIYPGAMSKPHLYVYPGARIEVLETLKVERS